MEGEIENVEVHGIVISRENARNSLYARSFDLDSADIHVVNLVDRDTVPSHKKEKEPIKVTPDSLVQALSLYDIISPVFARVAIDHIRIGNTQMQYAQTVQDSVETYSMEEFEFHAYDFLIDSVSESRRGLWYARNFTLDISGLQGRMAARNHRVEVDRVSLDTRRGFLHIENIELDPLSTKTEKDFLSARIDTLSLEGLLYEEGISVQSLRVSSPDINYTQAVTLNEETKKKTGTVEDIFSPLLCYLAIRDIRLTKGQLQIHERNPDGGNSFDLRNFNFFARNFLLNEQTWNSPDRILFTCDEYGISFRDFDNYLLNNTYRLSIRNGSFSNRQGNLFLQDVKLIPEGDLWEKTSAPYISFITPAIRVKGLNDLLRDFSYIKVDAIDIESPHIEIIQTKRPEQKEIKQVSTNYTPFTPFRKIDIGRLNLTHTQLAYENRSAGEKLRIEYDDLQMNKVLWNTTGDRTFDMNEFRVSSPKVDWKVTTYHSLPSSGESKTLREIFYPFAETIRIRKFYSDRIEVSATQPYLETAFQVESFEINDLNWQLKEDARTMDIGGIRIQDPDMTFHKAFAPVQYTEEIRDTTRTSVYEQLSIVGEEVRVGSIDIFNATIDYENLWNDTVKSTQTINTTNLQIEGLAIDNTKETFSLGDIKFYTKDLRFPINNGFYDIQTGDLSLQNDRLELNSFQMVSPYPKIYFAYLHPKHQDWFDARARKLEIEGIELPALFSGEGLYAKTVRIADPVLQNYKNRNIYVLPRWMPMIYEGLQKAPVKIDVEKAYVHNLEVIYEELAPKAVEPGRLVFTELNGTFSGLTNIVSSPEQYFRLDADGKLYGKGHFSAVWLLPVDSLNDRFILDGQLPHFDLTALNEIITPLASAELTSGTLAGFNFCMDASSQTGAIYMLLLYDDLKVNIFKLKDGEKRINVF